MKKCTNCVTTDPKGQWWYLYNYYKISGYFCPRCYEDVSHDSAGNPNHPIKYKMMLENIKLTSSS
jgi:hypothetical protein